MAANRTRVQVRGSIGKSVHIPAGSASSGATIGVDLRLPNGTIPTLQQLAAALQTGAATQDLPGNISPTGGAQALVWQNIQYVPQSVLNPPRPIPEDEPEDVRIIPGPPGRDGVIGVNGQPGVTIYPDDVDDVVQMPGPPGPTGNAGPQGSQGAPGVTIPMYPDDGEDQVFVPGPPGPAGAGGGGTSSPFNVTADTHTATPGNVANDEFEAGASIDTAGTRFAGATAWTVQNVGASVNSIANGALLVAPNKNAVDVPVFYTQPLAAPSAAWDVRCKILDTPALSSPNPRQGLWVGIVGTGVGYMFGRFMNGGTPSVYINRYSNFAGAGGTNVFIVSQGGVAAAGALWIIPSLYLRVTYDGVGVLTFYQSFDGIIWQGLTTINTATFLGAAATGWGVCVDGGSATSEQCAFDWARRIL